MARTDITTHLADDDSMALQAEVMPGIDEDGLRFSEPYVSVRQNFGGCDSTVFLSFNQFRTYREQMRAALDSVELPGDES